MIEVLISAIPGGTLTLVLSWLGIIGLAIWRVFAAGKKSARNDQTQERLRAREKADDIDEAIAGRSSEENRKKLKEWGR